jgi:hypothetical protein
MEKHDLVEYHTRVQMIFMLDKWIRLSYVIQPGRSRAQISSRFSSVILQKKFDENLKHDSVRKVLLLLIPLPHIKVQHQC